jgi:hypothetical protein
MTYLLAAVLVIVLLAIIRAARRRYKRNQRSAKIAAREWCEADKVRREIDFMYWRAEREVKWASSNPSGQH